MIKIGKALRTTVTALGLVSGLLAGASAVAQQHTNRARGFNADSVYQLGDIDHINLFNGNLTIDIPIGQEYSTNDGLKYRLRLVYNSNVWTYRELCTSNVSFSYEGFYSSWFIVTDGYTVFGHWDLIPNDSWWDQYEQPRFQSPDNYCLTAALPNPTSNAGFGWQVTLGELYPPRAGAWADLSPDVNESGRYMYVSPDGSEHLFFDALHVEEAAAPDAPPVPDPEWSYTRDGSYLRMHRVSGDVRTIEFPNGEIHTFHRDLGTTHRWRLVEIRDRYDNFLSIDYDTPNKWVLADSTGRTHEVLFASPGGGAEPVITEIKLAKFGGGFASYDFVHSPLHLERGCPSHPELATGTHVDVARLDEVVLPDGQRYRMVDYDESGSTAGCSLNGALLELEQPTGARVEWRYDNVAAGGTGTFFDPQRRWINGYVFPQGSSPRSYVRGSDGIRRRIVTDPVTGQVDTWTYEPHLLCEEENVNTLGECFDFVVGPGPRPEPPKKFATIVTPPDGTKRVHYFSVKTIVDVGEDPDPNGWDPAEYGLPLNRDVREETSGRPPLFLSWEVFPAGVDPFPVAAVPGDPIPPRPNPLRAGYVHYELDSPTYNSTDPSTFYSIPDSGFGEIVLLNRREAAARTVYYDSAGARLGHRDVWRSDFDGLGHYRTEEIAGQIAAVGNTPKTVVTNFNPGHGSYPQSFTAPATSQPWLPNRYDKIRRSQPGSSTFETRYCFDDETGFLHGLRALKNSASGEQARDALTRYVRSEDSSGPDGVVRLSELHFGGDHPGTVPSGCDGAITGPAEYRIDRSFRWGGLEAEQWVNDFNNEIELPSEDNSVPPPGTTGWISGVDRHTGLIGASRAPDGLVTRYEYDALGRLTRVTPQDGHSAVRVNEYQILWNGAAPRGARVDACSLPPSSTAACSSSSRLTYGFSLFDGRGRKIEEQKRFPADPQDCASAECFAKRRYQRGFGGTPKRRYEDLGSWQHAGSASAPHWTKTRFDEFDQVETVREPRGEIGETTFQHGGDWSTRIANWVFEHVPGDTVDGGEFVHRARWTTTDLLGRVVKVTELADETSPLAAVTRYEHDADDHLAKVRSHQADPTGEAGPLLQERLFCYDGRGFLVAERHPEIGDTGNGSIHYTYDSLGRVRSKLLVSAPPANLCAAAAPSYTAGFQNVRYEYDRAGRLITVRGVPRPDGGSIEVELEERFYARLNSTANRFGARSAGKLVQTKRFNPQSGLRLTETSVYQSPDGSLSAQQTRVSDDRGAYGFTQTFTYDALGNVTSQTYPQLDCPQGGCVGAPPVRTVTQSFKDDQLVRVTAGVAGQSIELAPTIAYHPNGLAYRVRHRNFGPGAGTTVETLEEIANDPFGLPRPGAVLHQAAGGAVWSSGAIDYDGIGNIFQLGSDRYAYDGAGRLQWSRQSIEEGCSTPPCSFEAEYDYDIPGNLLAIRWREDGTLVSRPVTPVSTATNRLSGPGTSYDRAGNVLLWDNRMAFTFDPLNRMAAQGSQGVSRQMAYDADGERLVLLDFQQEPHRGLPTLRLRGRNHEVLREVRRNADGSWSWLRDYLYRDRLTLAQVTPTTGSESLTHFYLDHLGTPRHSSGSSGFLGSYREYAPFGEELTRPRHESDFLQFTGHERDFNCLTGPASACAENSFQAKVDDLDHMHARVMSPWLAKFLSVDPLMGDVGQPQSWNRYAYVRNNPIAYADPTGNSALWNAVIRVFKISADGRRTVVAASRASTKRKQMAAVTQGLDQVTPSEMQSGTKRVVEIQGDRPDTRDAVSDALSPDGKARAVEKSGGRESRFAEHRNPSEGPYEDVHVQTSTDREKAERSANAAKAGTAGAGLMATLGQIFAPASSAMEDNDEASPGEILAAGLWDAVGACDPTPVTTIINHFAGIDEIW